MTASRLWIAACLIAVGPLVGCGNTKVLPPPIVEVEGIVLLDGAPLKKVQVRFIPAGEYGAEYYAVGITDDAGRFTLTCHGQPGACACENAVLVEECPLPKELKGEKGRLELAKYYQSLGGRPLPARYASLADNPLSVTVTAGQKTYNLSLSR